jgi:hypothetical protein
MLDFCPVAHFLFHVITTRYISAIHLKAFHQPSCWLQASRKGMFRENSLAKKSLAKIRMEYVIEKNIDETISYSYVLQAVHVIPVIFVIYLIAASQKALRRP